MKKFEKTAAFTKVVETLKKDAEKAELSDKKFKAIQNILTNSLPIGAPFTFKKAYVEESKMNDGTNTSHIRLQVDEEQSVSLSSLLAMGLKVGKTVSFKPSRKTSQLKGAGVLSGVEPVNPALSKFAGENGLNEIELAAALVGQEFTAKETEIITYFPQKGEEKSALELNELNDENRLSLCSVKKVYILA